MDFETKMEISLRWKPALIKWTLKITKGLKIQVESELKLKLEFQIDFDIRVELKWAI